MGDFAIMCCRSRWGGTKECEREIILELDNRNIEHGLCTYIANDDTWQIKDIAFDGEAEATWHWSIRGTHQND